MTSTTWELLAIGASGLFLYMGAWQPVIGPIVEYLK